MVVDVNDEPSRVRVDDVVLTRWTSAWVIAEVAPAPSERSLGGRSQLGVHPVIEVVVQRGHSGEPGNRETDRHEDHRDRDQLDAQRQPGEPATSRLADLWQCFGHDGLSGVV